uniref:Chlororespiratory reduction 4 n=1 Tax=Kalanchoe fedtschenkoi TaxID=63787 RepID=A0A7N0VHS8_KALFE
MTIMKTSQLNFIFTMTEGGRTTWPSAMIRKRVIDRCLIRQHRSTVWERCTSYPALKQIHASMVVKGFNSDPSALRELIFASSMIISGAIKYAHQVFDEITDPDIFMWNTVIRGSAQSPDAKKALLYYGRMDERGVAADRYTFPFLIKACTKLGWVRTGHVVHGRVMKSGFEESCFVRNTLIHFHANCGDLGVAKMLFEGSDEREVVAWSALTAGYARRGRLGEARSLFDAMPVKDLVSWNVMITGYANRGEMVEARKLFDVVPERDVVSWNAMISGYVHSECYKEGLEMFEEMCRAGEKPDDVTMLCLLHACASLGELDVGRRLHLLIIEMFGRNISILLSNALIDMYGKSGCISKALEVFYRMKERDLSSWNSILCGFAFHGHAEESIDMFKRMLCLKVRPDSITFVAVLIACSHAGRVEEGRGYFNMMQSKYTIEPNIKHFGCMVDMYGRAGLLNEALQLIETMHIKPNCIIWRTLLGACKVYGNVEMGKLANEQLLGLRQDHSGDYVLLSNIYASHGEWNGAEDVRKSMDDSGTIKERGYSLVEGDEAAFMQFLFDAKCDPQ